MERRDFLKLTAFGGISILTNTGIGFTGHRDKRIYLTIDDSPKEETTEEILKVLDTFGVKATFFCIGWRLNKFRSISYKILEAGHSLGNHSYTHRKFSTLNPERRIREILYTDRVLKSLSSRCEIPYRKVWRFPYGDTANDGKVFKFLKRKGYRVIGWDVDSQDWRYYSHRSPLSTRDIIRRSLRNESSITLLLHDIPITAKRVLPYLIGYYLDMGYTFERL